MVSGTRPFQGHPHPFLIDHVIEKVLGYLAEENICEIFNARLVCHQWSHYATKALRRKYYLSFGGHKYNIGRLKSFLDEVHPQGATPDLVVDENGNYDGTYLDTFPVTRFRLFSDLFQDYNKPTVLTFMSNCGPITEALVIYKDINSDIEYSDDELSKFNFPRLKELSFADRRRSHVSVDANHQSFLYQIVSSSQDTLTSLTIKFPREPIYEIYEKEELIIKVLSQCRLQKNLKHLKLDMSITDKILVKLSKLNLRLHSLQLCLGASQFLPKSLKALLESLKNTLVELKLTDLYRRASLAVDLPKMEYVKSFEIHGLELPAYFVTFQNFTYESKLPNLAKLRLNTWAPTKEWEVFVPDGKSKPLINEVVTDLSLAMNFDCPVLMGRVANMFVGVRKLEMHFSRGSVEALQTVFKNMRQLEELKLNQSYLGEMTTNCIDDVLTGLDPEECRWILRKRAYAMMDLGQIEKRPCLLDLKNLKKLDMLGLRYRNQMTDVSGYLVFLVMENLRTIDVGRSEFSETCLRDLAEKFPNGRFQKYLTKKRMKPYDYGLYKNSVFTSICLIQ